MTTQYEKLKTNLKRKAGRPPLPAEEKARRKEAQRVENRRRQEARRRAGIVLQHKYESEFEKILTEEYNALLNDERYSR